MLLDNVYRALSPKGAFFFTLNKTFNLIKSDYFFLPQPVDLKKKKQASVEPKQDCGQVCASLKLPVTSKSAICPIPVHA